MLLGFLATKKYTVNCTFLCDGVIQQAGTFRIALCRKIVKLSFNTEINNRLP